MSARFRVIKAPKHRHIAPRLASGEHRIPAGNALPPIIKFALTQIANAEGKSRSWVIEEIVIDWCRHDPRLQGMLRGAVDYVARKRSAEEVEAEAKTKHRAKVAS